MKLNIFCVARNRLLSTVHIRYSAICGGVLKTTKIKPNVAEKNMGANVIYTVR